MHGRSTLLVPFTAAALAAVAAAPAPAGELGNPVRDLLARADGAVAGAVGNTLRLGGRQCALIPVPAAAPFGRASCRGTRPGALVETREGFCTMNFLFRDRDGRRYIGTAGHCTIGSGERHWRTGGPFARNRGGRIIGRFRYAVLRGERDFGLIELREGVRASRRMCHFGGPTGVSDRRTRRTVSLHAYGQGLVTGDLTPGRTFIATGMPSSKHVFVKGTIAPGDSGGPVIRAGSGRAVGLMVTYGVHQGRSLLDNGSGGVARLPWQERRAEVVTGERFEIVRARQR